MNGISSKQKYENLKNMVRVINHEMKNSLTALQFAEDEESKAVELKRLADLTNATSDFLKNPKGEPVKIELVSFLGDLSKHFSQKVKVSSSEDQIFVMFDAEKVRSVFENLIKNACESADGKDANVEINLLRKNRTVIVRILDRGNGIKEEDKEKLFDFCYTTKANGSGIGLALVKLFVEAQRGTIKLYSRDGGGTVAEVVLPAIGDKNE